MTSDEHPHDRVESIQTHNNEEIEANSRLSLNEFISILPSILLSRTVQIEKKKKDMLTLISRVDLPKSVWEKYAHSDSSKKYTRNLISTDDESYTLLLLVWNPNCESPIHDHPCDGCWMKVLEGQVSESRYEIAIDNNQSSHYDNLTMTQHQLYSKDSITFVNDTIGLHKISNPDKEKRAITLHIYSPPFQSCKLWTHDGSNETKTTTLSQDGSENGTQFKCYKGNVALFSIGGVKCID